MNKRLKTYLCIAILIVSQIPGKTQIVDLKKVGSYNTGLFDESATEISAFDPATNYLFSVKW